jgi:hypothetical protein
MDLGEWQDYEKENPFFFEEMEILFPFNLLHKIEVI